MALKMPKYKDITMKKIKPVSLGSLGKKKTEAKTTKASAKKSSKTATKKTAKTTKAKTPKATGKKQKTGKRAASTGKFDRASYMSLAKDIANEMAVKPVSVGSVDLKNADSVAEFAIRVVMNNASKSMNDRTIQADMVAKMPPALAKASKKAYGKGQDSFGTQIRELALATYIRAAVSMAAGLFKTVTKEEKISRAEVITAAQTVFSTGAKSKTKPKAKPAKAKTSKKTAAKKSSKKASSKKSSKKATVKKSSKKDASKKSKKKKK